MIWPEMWCFVLAVVLMRARWRRTVYRLTSRAKQQSALRQHGMVWSRPRLREMVCGCSVCVSEFDHFNQWVQIA